MNEPHTSSSDGDKAEQGRQQPQAAERNARSGGPFNEEAGAAGGQQADTLLGAAAAETAPAAAAAAARAADARASTTAAPAGRGAPSARTGGKANPRKWTPKELETLVNIFHTALRFTQRHEHEAEDSARLRAKTETSTLLRAYAQAVGPNCNDPQVRQRALEAARQQQAQEDLEEAEVAAARAGVAGAAGQQAAAGGGAAASAGSPLSASGTVSPRASAGAASSSRLPSSAGGGDGPGSAAAASQSVDVVGVDAAVAAAVRQAAAQRTQPPWHEAVDGPPHGPAGAGGVTALSGGGVDGPGQQAAGAGAAEETQRPSGTEAVSGLGGPAAREQAEAVAPPCEGGHAAGGGSIPEPMPTAADAGGGGPLAPQTTAGLEHLGTAAAALLPPPPLTSATAAAASAQADQEALVLPLWPHGLQGLAGPPQPRPLSSPLPLMHARGPPAPPPFPAAADVLQEPWSEGVSTVAASSSLLPASAPGYPGPLDEALSLLLEPLPPPPAGAGGGGGSSGGSLGGGQGVPAAGGGGRMHSAGWLASGVRSGPPGPLAAGPHGAAGAHASFDSRWQQTRRSLLAPAATALAPAALSSEQASYASALIPPPPPVPHGGPPPWAVPSQLPAPPALLPPVAAAAEVPWDSPWSASHAAGLMLHGGPPAPPLQRPRLAHPPYPQQAQQAQHPQQQAQQQALQPLGALAVGGMMPPPPSVQPEQQQQQQLHLYPQLGVPLLPQLGARLQMQQVQLQPTTMWAVGGSVGSSGAWASGPPSAGAAGRGDLDLSAPLQLAAPQGQQQRPHTLPQQPPWLTDLEPSIEEIWYNMLSEN
ncbi:hypothetical protein HYH03_011219 [Edaphochlamys debaryana]|uniref:Uncharacterized protein n=1 Tax=Edaphochlamys debaryana TaxID=47281 RepID=A0A835Y392_9CHLO|nr:hypothetical protein HYH03_011219 [Edaphochlamys debaryana]|eukprot:KAG2490264.1 hypothetical protein HYH03_011219 [Edaphochlamys debaryana]